MLNGWKTYAGATLAAIPLAYAAAVAGAWGELMVVIGGWLTAIGAAHKYAKATAGPVVPKAPPAAAVVPVLMLALMLTGCATSATGEQAQDTSQGTVDQKAWGGLFSTYKDSGKGSKRTTTAPVLDKAGQPVLGVDGQPMFTTIIEDGASGPLVLNYGTISANIEQSPQGSQAGSGTQGKEDTSTPTNTTSPTTNVSIPAVGGP